MIRLFVMLLVSLGIFFANTTQKVYAQGDIERTERCINNAIDYIKAKQDPKTGSWNYSIQYPHGVDALCTLALLNAGVDANDPVILKSIARLRNYNLDKGSATYTVSLIAMVLSYTRNKAYANHTKRCVDWLETAQRKVGGWSYQRDSSNQASDTSNTQFAILGLYEAERAFEDITVNNSVWTNAYRYLKGCRNANGSFGYYIGDRRSIGSMTCAGISSYIIIADQYREMSQPDGSGELECCQGETNLSAELKDIEEGIANGINWLSRSFSIVTNPGGESTRLFYYRYSLERVGRLSARRFFGARGERHDWYREGVNELVKTQNPIAGNWSGPNVEPVLIRTALALLFLAKGRRPTLIAKMEYSPKESDWNQHSKDAAELTAYVEERWKRDLSWQIVDVTKSTVEDLLQAPIIYFSGSDGQAIANFTDETVKNLRDYVEQGGFIFAEACCDGNNAGFDRSFRDLIKRMFPDTNGALVELAPDHPVYRMEETIPFQTGLYGVQVSCRTSIMYSAKDVSCRWSASKFLKGKRFNQKTRSDIATALSLGLNIVAYATNRELKYKYENFDLEKKEDKVDHIARSQVRIAKIRHGGDSDVAPGALPNLRTALMKLGHVKAEIDQSNLEFAKKGIFDYPVIFMHGRTDFRLSENDIKNLRLFVERGGTVIADSVCASESFQKAFRREILRAFPESEFERIPKDDKIFTPAFGGIDITAVELRDLRKGAQVRTTTRKVTPVIETIKHKNRYAILFSPYDISCALENQSSPDCPGYTPKDALKIGVNLVLYTLQLP